MMTSTEITRKMKNRFLTSNPRNFRKGSSGFSSFGRSVS